MVTTLSELIQMIEQGTVPDWWRQQILAKRAEIERALREGGTFTLNGLNGEELKVHAEKQAVAA